MTQETFLFHVFYISITTVVAFAVGFIKGSSVKGLPKFDNPPPPPPPKKIDKDYEYGTVDGKLSRRHRAKGNVQFILWKAGEQGHILDYWHDYDKSWWEHFTTNDFKHVNYESGYFVFTLLEEVDSFSNSEGKRFVYTMHLHSQVVYSSIEKAQKDIESVFAVNAPSWQQFMILPATLKQL